MHVTTPRTPLRAALAGVALLVAAPVAPAHAVPDQGITSAVHRRNVGKIRFSKQPIPFKRERPGQLTGSFRAADPIYGRLYLRRSLANHVHFTKQGHKHTGSGRGQWGVRVYVDGKEHRYAFGWFHQNNIAGKARDRFTTFQVNLNAPGNQYDNRKLRTNWARTVAKLAPGRHRVRVEVWSMVGSFQTRRPVAVGTFTLVKRKGEGLAAGRLPKAVLRNAGLSAAMRSALRKRRIAKSARDIRKVVISSAWQHGRYRGTVRRYRMVNGTVVWRDKKGNGMCRFVTYKFVSDRRGGRWTPLRFRGFCNGCPEGYVRCR